MEKILKAGDTVYFLEKHLDYRLGKGRVKHPLFKDEKLIGYEVHSTPYTFSNSLAKTYYTEAEALAAQKQILAEIRGETLKETQTPKDFVSYLMDFVNIETCSWESILVVRERANEYFGITIED